MKEDIFNFNWSVNTSFKMEALDTFYIWSGLTPFFIATMSCQMTFLMTCSILLTEAFNLIFISLIDIILDNNIFQETLFVERSAFWCLLNPLFHYKLRLFKYLLLDEERMSLFVWYYEHFEWSISCKILIPHKIKYEMFFKGHQEKIFPKSYYSMLKLVFVFDLLYWNFHWQVFFNLLM